MNDISLKPEIVELKVKMSTEIPQYILPIIPNPDEDPTEELTKAKINDIVYEIVDLLARQTLLLKVDKESGKGLSSNDYTNEDKSKLNNIQAGAEVNVQSDFAQNDNSKDDFIKNKPTKVSDFTNDTGFITNTVNNLVNYYLKSEIYTKTEVNSLVQPFAQFAVVQTLPVEDISLTTIYLVPKNPAQTDNIYDEYINTDGTSSGWEKIGDTEVDLSNYYTKSETYSKSEVDASLLGKVDKVEGKGLSANDFTDTLKDKLDGIEAEANKTVVDNSVTATSTNPVESKAIYNLLNDLLPEATETGNPIAISNASGFNAKALTVDMLPIQAGSGTPSSDNPRHISGRNSLDITVNGNTEIINFSETVYGGSCDVTTGVLTVKYLTFKLSNYTWNMDANNTGVFVAEVTPIKPKNYAFICEQFVSKNVSTSILVTGEGKFLLIPTRTYLYLCNKSYDNVNDFMTSINNVTLCYELANYQTIQLTPEQIELVKGNNTLSTSGDNMDLKYSTTISNPTSLSMGNPLSLSSPNLQTVTEPEVEEPAETE